MRITYDNFGRVSEVKFDEGEDQERGFKAFEALVKEQAAVAMHNADNQVEWMKYQTNRMQYNMPAYGIQFPQQLKQCNLDNDPTKDIALTT